MDEKMGFSTEVSADKKDGTDLTVHSVSEPAVVGTCETIYIDPEKEAACRAKFDKFVVPVSVIFLVLSTLDRNNVSLSA